MESNGKHAGSVTPSKASKSKLGSENFNPNLTSLQSPPTKTPHKSATKNPNRISSPSPCNKIRERKFVVAKKNSKKEKSNTSTAAAACKCTVSGKKSNKCLCVAYETLRASQEEFFKNRGQIDDQCELLDRAENEVEEEELKNSKIENCAEGKLGQNEIEQSSETGSTNAKRTRERLLEEARKNEPEPGSGKVMHLVKAFEKLLSIPKTKESSDQVDDGEEELEEDSKKGMKWALPGLQQPRVFETQVSSSSFCPSDFFLTSENLGLDCRVSSSLDSNHGRLVLVNV